MAGLVGGQMVIEASSDFMNLNILVHTPPYFRHRIWTDLVESCKKMVFLTPWLKSFRACGAPKLGLRPRVTNLAPFRNGHFAAKNDICTSHEH